MDTSHEGEIKLDPGFQSRINMSGRAGLWDEKTRIEHRREQLTLQTRELAFQHYPTFISAAECCTDIAKDFKNNQVKLAEMLEKLPKLTEACNGFRDSVQKVSMHRKRTSLVLTKHPKLLEVLELPQLMDTCVKNGHHEEALAIQQLCNKIQKPLGHIPVVKSILDAVHNSSLWMLNQLLARLKCHIQLPECLKIIGYIRRIGAFNETQLRLKFLQARQAYFSNTLQQQLQQAGSLDDYSYLCRVIELTRICVFDTITQYRALFSDEDSMYSSPTMGIGGAPIAYRQIFPSWLFWKLNCFKETFQARLSKNMEEQQIDSLIGQAMYFGQSLGRVGYDFRISMVPMFLDIILDKARDALAEGRVAFETFVTTENVLERQDESNVNIVDANGENLIKLSFYALAEACNSVVMACNRLRYSAPVASYPMMVQEIQNFVEKVLTIFTDLKPKILKDSSHDSPEKLFEEFENQFYQRVLPFCNLCLDRTFAEDSVQLQAVAKFGVKKDIELVNPYSSPPVEVSPVEEDQVIAPETADVIPEPDAGQPET